MVSISSQELFKKEQRLRELQETQPDSPDLFLLLLDFCNDYVRVSKLNLPEHELEDICTDFAENIYFRIQSKGPLVKSNHPFVNYLHTLRKSVLYERYHTETYWSIAPYSWEQQQFMSNFCDPLSTVHTLALIETMTTIQSIPNMVENILNNSKYYDKSKEYLNAETSLLLSLLTKEYTPYNQTDVEVMYGRMLYQRLYTVLSETIKSTINAMEQGIGRDMEIFYYTDDNDNIGGQQ